MATADGKPQFQGCEFRLVCFRFVSNPELKVIYKGSTWQTGSTVFRQDFKTIFLRLFYLTFSPII